MPAPTQKLKIMERNPIGAGREIEEGEVAPIFKSTSATVDNNAFKRTSPIGSHWRTMNRPAPSGGYGLRGGISEIDLMVFAIIRVAPPWMRLYESRFLKAASPRANSFFT